MIDTYGGQYPNGDKSYGGYANYARVPSHFVCAFRILETCHSLVGNTLKRVMLTLKTTQVFKIPDALTSEVAAPMLCGGIALYSPLTKNGCGSGKKVGIIGVGGLGHFGLLFAKVLSLDRPH